jgi:uncharacterized membrane protein
MVPSEGEQLQALLKRLERLEWEVEELKRERRGWLRRRAGLHAPSSPPEPEFIFEEVEGRASTSTFAPGPPPGETLENALGTRWIGRIGMVAVVFGIAFFLKYTFDNNLIGPTGRVILGLVAGLFFLCCGEWLRCRKKMPGFAQVLSGGGIAILYFALYAAYAFYHLVPIVLAFAAFIAVTTTGMTLAVRTLAVSLAALGLLGGFLTPVLLSTGENHPLALFGYVLVLDLGILTVVHLRGWKWLSVAALTGTVLLYAAWHDRFYSSDQEWLAFGIVTLFFLFYNGSVLLAEVFRRGRPLLPLELVFGSAAFYALAAWAQQGWSITWTLKLFLAALALLEAGLALLHRRRRLGETGIAEGFAAVSAVFTVAATMAFLDQRWLTAALAAEMAALVGIGFKVGRFSLRLGGYLLTLIVLLRLVDEYPLHLEPFATFVPILNGRFLVWTLVIASCYVVFGILLRGKDRLAVDERYLAGLYFCLSQLLTVALLSLECTDFFRFGRWPGIDVHYAQQASLSVVWAAYAALLTGVGIARKIRFPRLLGIALFSVTVAKVFFLDLSNLRTAYRIVSFIILGLLLLGVSYIYNRHRDRLFGEKS